MGGFASERHRRPPPDRQRLARYFFFGVFLLLLHQALRMLMAFYLPLLAAGLLAMVLYPTHRRFRRTLRLPPTTAAALTTVGAAVLIVLPVCGLGWVFFHEAAKLAPVARAWLQGLGDRQSRALATLAPLRGSRIAVGLQAWQVDPQELLLANLEALAARCSVLLAALVGNLIMVFLDLAALVCLLFVLLRDGPRLLRRALGLIPLAPEYREMLRARIEETALAVVRGALGLALLQGALAGIGLALFHVPFPVLLGALTTLASPIPLVGSYLILGPVILCLYLSGFSGQAIRILLWSLTIVGGSDHVLRPLWISAAARLPVWLLFFGVLGGLRLYGFAGLLVGPVLVTVALCFASIYRREYSPLIGQKSRLTPER